MLAKLALIHPKMLSLPAIQSGSKPDDLFKDGDFVAIFHACTKIDKKHCPDEMGPYLERAEKSYKGKS
jgi:hypothetical protein